VSEGKANLSTVVTTAVVKPPPKYPATEDRNPAAAKETVPVPAVIVVTLSKPRIKVEAVRPAPTIILKLAG
jgi:hypothetical protein